MCDKQVESCIVNVPCDRLCEIMFSPKMDFSKMMPCIVKSQSVSKGAMSTVGCVFKLEYVDGTTTEAEVTFSDPTKYKISFKYLSCDKPCF
jgi:hypothetical protein